MKGETNVSHQTHYDGQKTAGFPQKCTCLIKIGSWSSEMKMHQNNKVFYMMFSSIYIMDSTVLTETRQSMR